MGRSEGLTLVLVEGGILAIGCFFLLRYYQALMVTKDISITVYLSWILGLAGILYLPYDICVALEGDSQSEKGTETLLMWNTIYWSTFFLAWIILPLQMEFHSSGHFTFKEKLIDSLRRNLLFLLIALVLGIVFVIFLILSGTGGDVHHVIGFLMAMSNTYGVFIITLLLGSGLVAFPRLLWQSGFPLIQLTKLYLTAEIVEADFQNARLDLEDLELEVMKMADNANVKNNLELSQYAFLLQTDVANFEFNGRSMSRRFNAGNESSRGNQKDNTANIDKMSLVSLNARLKLTQMRVRACEKKWQNHVFSAYNLEKKSTEAHLATSTSAWCSCTSWPSNASFVEKLFYIKDGCIAMYRSFQRRFGQIFARILAILCASASTIILWSELVMSTPLSSPIGLFLEFLSNRTSDFISIQVIALLTLAYMSVCMYWSLFRLNLGAAYRLQGPQLSLPPSLIFNAQYFSRLQFALGYNFLMMLNIDGTDLTSFNVLMQNMNTIPVFGNGVTVYVPTIMMLVAILTLFNGYGRLIRLVGIDSEDAATSSSSSCCGTTLNDEDIKKLDIGKKLIATAVRGMGLLQSHDDRDRTFQSPLRPANMLSNLIPQEGSNCKYKRATTISQQADSGRIDDETPVETNSDEDEETVDFSVLFQKKAVGSQREKQTTTTAPSQKPAATMSRSSFSSASDSRPLVQNMDDDNYVDPLNEAIGTGIKNLTNFFKNIAVPSDQSSSFWGRQQQAQRVSQVDDEEAGLDAHSLVRMTPEARRLAELQLAAGQQGGATSTTAGRYK